MVPRVLSRRNTSSVTDYGSSLVDLRGGERCGRGERERRVFRGYKRARKHRTESHCHSCLKVDISESLTGIIEHVLLFLLKDARPVGCLVTSGRYFGIYFGIYLLYSLCNGNARATYNFLKTKANKQTDNKRQSRRQGRTPQKERKQNITRDFSFVRVCVCVFRFRKIDRKTENDRGKMSFSVC